MPTNPTLPDEVRHKAWIAAIGREDLYDVIDAVTPILAGHFAAERDALAAQVEALSAVIAQVAAEMSPEAALKALGVTQENWDAAVDSEFAAAVQRYQFERTVRVRRILSTPPSSVLARVRAEALEEAAQIVQDTARQGGGLQTAENALLRAAAERNGEGE